MKFIVGRDDMLFLDNDTNGVLQQTAGRAPPRLDFLQAIWQRHLCRKLLLRNDGAEYFHIVAPNKETIYLDALPAGVIYEEVGPTPYKTYLDHFGGAASPARHPLFGPMTFFRPELLRSPGFTRHPPYSRTDTHWTPEAATAYLGTFFAGAGLDAERARLDALPSAEREVSFLGDLGLVAKVAHERLVERRPSPLSHVIRFANNIANEGYCRHTVTGDAGAVGKRVLVIHDSFTHALFETISEVFAEVLYLHTPDLDTSFVAGFKPDLVLFIQVERFFPRLISNEVSFVDWLARKAMDKGVEDITSGYIRRLGEGSPRVA